MIKYNHPSKLDERNSSAELRARILGSKPDKRYMDPAEAKKKLGAARSAKAHKEADREVAKKAERIREMPRTGAPEPTHSKIEKVRRILKKDLEKTKERWRPKYAHEREPGTKGSISDKDTAAHKEAVKKMRSSPKIRTKEISGEKITRSLEKLRKGGLEGEHKDPRPHIKTPGEAKAAATTKEVVKAAGEKAEKTKGWLARKAGEARAVAKEIPHKGKIAAGALTTAGIALAAHKMRKRRKEREKARSKG